MATRSALALLAALTMFGAAPAVAQDHDGHAHAPAPSGDVSILTSEDRVLGDMAAPVTVIEYASFTCIHCAEWWTGGFPDFKARFIDTGRVRLVLRDLPTAPVEVAFPAAMLARCAPPERFADVADALFGGRMALQTMDDVPQWLGRAADAGGLDGDQAAQCLGDDANLEALIQRIAAARGFGVTGTPTFFVQGVRASTEDLEAAIAAAEAAPRAP